MNREAIMLEGTWREWQWRTMWEELERLWGSEKRCRVTFRWKMKLSRAETRRIRLHPQPPQAATTRRLSRGRNSRRCFSAHSAKATNAAQVDFDDNGDSKGYDEDSEDDDEELLGAVGEGEEEWYDPDMVRFETSGRQKRQSCFFAGWFRSNVRW